jgi:hypothetical protein
MPEGQLTGRAPAQVNGHACKVKPARGSEAIAIQSMNSIYFQLEAASRQESAPSSSIPPLVAYPEDWDVSHCIADTRGTHVAQDAQESGVAQEPPLPFLIGWAVHSKLIQQSRSRVRRLMNSCNCLSRLTPCLFHHSYFLHPSTRSLPRLQRKDRITMSSFSRGKAPGSKRSRRRASQSSTWPKSLLQKNVVF